MAGKLDAKVRRLAQRLGAQMLEARTEAGYSQRELAERIGMSRTNYARIEHGQTNVTIETLLRISEGLGRKITVTLSD